MVKFGLEVTRIEVKIIAYGRYAKENNKRRSQKPDTFDFLDLLIIAKEQKRKFRVKAWLRNFVGVPLYSYSYLARPIKLLQIFYSVTKVCS
ncbi:hypothetical protein [Natranaerofaba carboxydovora]|uniref:hypothetical protein n=1 Tax=Natranaerofaba carboxydovora TaxID=2742683 RepID=UPI001F129B90|nr:hypothetical protein [Natranaerofaba carboxydovora]UMZ74286.1 hypothetical protein ACONDI_01873 [Natranaerofaba carboxydovora]